MKQDIASLQSRLDDLQTKIQEGRSAQARLPQFREQVRRLELELDKLLRILPARLNTQEILRNVRTLAEQGDFDLKEFQPGNLTDKEFYKEWPIRIRLDGQVPQPRGLLRQDPPLSADLQHREPDDQRHPGREQSAHPGDELHREDLRLLGWAGRRPATAGRRGAMRAASSVRTWIVVLAVLLVAAWVGAAASASPQAEQSAPAQASGTAAAPTQEQGADQGTPAAQGEDSPRARIDPRPTRRASRTSTSFSRGRRRSSPARATATIRATGGIRSSRCSLRPRSRTSAGRGRRGFPGLLIDEVILTGIFRTEAGYVAQVQSAENEKSYLLKQGDQLYDGDVVRITGNEVVFKQIVQDPTALKPFREVVKTLSSERG